MQDLRGERPQAIQTRQQAVEVLRRELDPMPRGVFGPAWPPTCLMPSRGIPTATAAEKRQAVEMVLKHEVVPPDLRQRMEKALAEIR